MEINSELEWRPLVKSVYPTLSGCSALDNVVPYSTYNIITASTSASGICKAERQSRHKHNRKLLLRVRATTLHKFQFKSLPNSRAETLRRTSQIMWTFPARFCIFNTF